MTAARTADEVSVLKFFALHLLLALLWSALVGWTEVQLGLGVLVGLAVIAASARAIGSFAYLRSLGAAAQLVALFAVALVASNLQLARDILRPRPRFVPAILSFDVSSLGRLNTALLVSLVSLTPGSLSIDLDGQGRTLFVHTLYAGDEEHARRSVQRYVRLLERIAGGRADGAREVTPS